MAAEARDTFRIAIVVTSAVTANNFVHGFAAHLAEGGHEVTILADGLEPSVRYHGEGKITAVPVNMKRSPHPLKDALSLVSLTREIRRIHPDVLTYATPKASLLASLAGKLLRVPVRVYQLWGLRLETTRGPLRQILRAMERATTRHSTHVLANSPSLATQFMRLGLDLGKPLEVLGRGSSHGVDLERFSPDLELPPIESTAKKFVSSGVIIGFVGRLHPDKGIDTLLHAAIICRGKGIDVRLLLVGWEEGAHPGLILGDSSFVHISGPVADPRPYYREMDALALPSRREGFPNVILEAAAMQVPALVSDATGAIDSVIDGVTGLIFPVDDAEALAEVITTIATAPGALRAMSKAARHFVVEHYAQEVVWGLYANRLQTLKAGLSGASQP